MGSTVLKHEVYLNGQKLDFVSSFNWETPPQHSFQDIKDIGTVHDRRIQVTTYMKGAGSATVLAPVGMPSNDPMSLMDILGFRQRYTAYNTTTGILEHNTTIYDTSYGSDGTLQKPLVPHEIRQTEANGEIIIDSDGTHTPNTQIAQKFKAHCTDVTTLKLKLRDIVTTQVATLNVEIWSDNSGTPNAILSGAVINETGMSITDGTDYEDATWVTVDLTGINDTTALVPGTNYWLVLEAAESDPLYINKTTNNRYSPGALWKDTGSWSVDSGDLTFILQGTDSYGGHNIIIYDYTSGDTAYRKYVCYGCHVVLDGIGVTSQEQQTANLSFSSEKIEITKG